MPNAKCLWEGIQFAHLNCFEHSFFCQTSRCHVLLTTAYDVRELDNSKIITL